MTERFFRIEFVDGTHTKWTWDERKVRIELDENKDNPKYKGAHITWYEGRTYF